MFKRVHFAPTNRIYSPGTATPSPTLTASSLLSSSPGLSTPPPEDDDAHYAIYPRTPYSGNMELYSDVVIPKPFQIHFLLAFLPDSPPAFPYDLVYPPTNGDGKYPIQAFIKHATSPPLHSIIITHALLKFDIEITALPGSQDDCVTVADVLISLYRYLRLAIHPVEYAELSDGERREGVDAAYYVRCGRIRDPEERLAEERKGIKKIDLLMGCTRFIGLSGTHAGPEVWELNVA